MPVSHLQEFNRCRSVGALGQRPQSQGHLGHQVRHANNCQRVDAWTGHQYVTQTPRIPVQYHAQTQNMNNRGRMPIRAQSPVGIRMTSPPPTSYLRSGSLTKLHNPVEAQQQPRVYPVDAQQQPRVSSGHLLEQLKQARNANIQRGQERQQLVSNNVRHRAGGNVRSRADLGYSQQLQPAARKQLSSRASRTTSLESMGRFSSTQASWNSSVKVRTCRDSGPVGSGPQTTGPTAYAYVKPGNLAYGRMASGPMAAVSPASGSLTTCTLASGSLASGRMATAPLSSGRMVPGPITSGPMMLEHMMACQDREHEIVEIPSRYPNEPPVRYRNWEVRLVTQIQRAWRKYARKVREWHWNLEDFRRRFEEYSEGLGWLGKSSWLRERNLICGAEFAEPRDEYDWEHNIRYAENDKRKDPWGHKWITEHMKKMFNRSPSVSPSGPSGHEVIRVVPNIPVRVTRNSNAVMRMESMIAPRAQPNFTTNKRISISPSQREFLHIGGQYQNFQPSPRQTLSRHRSQPPVPSYMGINTFRQYPYGNRPM